jgi:hypothetical protein
MKYEYMNRLLRSPSVLLLILVLLIVGCRFPWAPQSVEVADPSSPEVRAQYEKALDAYLKGDYQGAAEQFEVLREQSSGGSMARMALYGQACAELMAAEKPQDYQTALDLWKTWLSCAPKEYHVENPVIMAPLVKEKMLFSNLQPANDDTDSFKDIGGEQTTQWVLIKTRQELDNLKEKLIFSEKAVKQREKKIGTLEKEIARLKDQIQALETIDQKIQEKKSAIPSAD